MSSPMAAFAACLPGLEPLLADELRALGAAPTPLAGGVAFPADQHLLLRAGLRLGTASHVLVRLTSFRCRALGELERKAAVLPWRDWLRGDVPALVSATARRSRIFHTGAIVERIERALVGALGKLPPAPPTPAESIQPVARLAVRFDDDHCTISLDTTATPLHRRGYRLAGAKAPLREDIAHALLLAAGVDAAGNDRGMLDPFCGSGTIAIEAAALLQGLAPGRLRPPPLQHLAIFSAAAWREVLAEPIPAAQNTAIAGSDRDAGAIEAARANAERAGVADRITFTCAALRAQPWLQEPKHAPSAGWVVSNPPYGLRVGAKRDLLPLYQSFGKSVLALGKNWSATLLAHDLRLARRSGLPLQARLTTRHGGIAVTMMTPAD